MSYRFPDLVDPWRLCEQGERIEGRIPLGSFPRLAPLLVSEKGDASFVLAFGKTERNRPVISCEVKAALSITCQRCLDSMVLVVEERSSIVPVRGLEEAEQLPQDMEPLWMESEDVFRIRDLIEDELLLAIPAAPRHRPDECSVDLADVCGDPPVEEKDTDGDNPFAILADMKSGETD